MRPWREPSPRLVVTALAVLLAASACVERDPPGVAIKKLAADIVFGVKPPAPDAPPANLAPGATREGDAVTLVPAATPARAVPPPAFASPRPPRLPTTRLPRPTPLGPAKGSCPPAALNAFPAQEAGLTVSGMPAVGQYRWKRQGTQTTPNLPGVKLPISGFEQRLVRNVAKISDTEFTFETVQPELGTNVTVLSTFKVKTGTVSRGVEPPVERLPVDLPNAVPVEPPTFPSRRVGDPERGISLQRIERIDAQGNSQVLNFNPAVLYLPLEVEPGESYEAVGIDARTGQVLQHQARVLSRERVDACGEIVDGWAVEATQTFSGASTVARTYRYLIAPQLGGIMISEEFHVTSPQGNTDVVISLGQLKPGPLPQEQQKG